MEILIRQYRIYDNFNRFAFIILINLGKPPALPERLPEFDNSGSISKPPRIEPLKVQKGGLQ